MTARAYLIITLLLSLLFLPQVPNAAAHPMEAKMPGCTMAACASGCCAQMACCAISAQDERPSEQAPAPQRVSVDIAAFSLHAFSVLYMLPVAERQRGPRKEARTAHTLPRLAATCIQLI